MTEPGAEFVSVAEASRRLGIQERQVRRYASRLPDTDRTDDRTPTGRPRTLVRMSALCAVVEAARARGQHADSGPDISPDGDRTQDRTPAAQTMALSVAYERVIEEQAARITDLKAQLDRMNEALQLAQENLAREQHLRALPPPQAPTGESGGCAPSTESGPQEGEEPRRPWWRRLW